MPIKNNSTIVCFGEILWDLLPGKALPGGAPMNVAYHLYHLGIDPVLLTRVGDDERGRELLQILESKKVPTGLIQLDTTHPTGIARAFKDQWGDISYDIVAPAAWDYIEFDPAMEAIVQQAHYFVYGSLSTRNKQSRETLFQLLEIAANKVLDINLRVPHFTQTIVMELLEKANIVKMNIEELELITDWWGHYTNTAERMLLIQDRFNIPSIIVTRGAEGAMVNMDGSWFEHPGYRVTVADTIGSGDSFLAAFISQLLQNKPPEEALLFASGLGALVASKTGGWPEYSVDEVRTIIHEQTI